MRPSIGDWLAESTWLDRLWWLDAEFYRVLPSFCFMIEEMTMMIASMDPPNSSERPSWFDSAGSSRPDGETEPEPHGNRTGTAREPHGNRMESGTGRVGEHKCIRLNARRHRERRITNTREIDTEQRYTRRKRQTKERDWWKERERDRENVCVCVCVCNRFYNRFMSSVAGPLDKGKQTDWKSLQLFNRFSFVCWFVCLFVFVTTFHFLLAHNGHAARNRFATTNAIEQQQLGTNK